MSFTVRRYCRTGKFLRRKTWDWQDVATLNDEADARQRFNEIVSRGYSPSCRGYALVAKRSPVFQEEIMSAWDYRH